MRSTRGGTRTLTPLRATDFESVASAIPPLWLNLKLVPIRPRFRLRVVKRQFPVPLGMRVNGRGGVMPTWGQRLDPITIDALAVYVHSLGGGE